VRQVQVAAPLVAFTSTPANGDKPTDRVRRRNMTFHQPVQRLLQLLMSRRQIGFDPSKVGTPKLGGFAPDQPERSS
jgi:hypothetical protein